MSDLKKPEPNPRAERLDYYRKVLQFECCPPHKGENAMTRKAKRRPRGDRYKNHR